MQTDLFAVTFQTVVSFLGLRFRIRIRWHGFGPEAIPTTAAILTTFLFSKQLATTGAALASSPFAIASLDDTLCPFAFAGTCTSRNTSVVTQPAASTVGSALAFLATTTTCAAGGLVSRHQQMSIFH